MSEENNYNTYYCTYNLLLNDSATLYFQIWVDYIFEIKMNKHIFSKY